MWLTSNDYEIKVAQISLDFKAVNITRQQVFYSTEKPYNVSERRWKAAKKQVQNND